MTDSRELLNATFGVVELLDPALSFGVSLLERVPERLQPRVKLDDAYSHKDELAK